MKFSSVYAVFEWKNWKSGSYSWELIPCEFFALTVLTDYCVLIGSRAYCEFFAWEVNSDYWPADSGSRVVTASDTCI